MRAPVRAAAAAAVLSALGSFDRPPPPPAPAVVAPIEVRGVDGLAAFCPPGTLPEGPVCLPFDRAAPARPPPLRSVAGPPIPRRPDRPAALGAYLYPAGTPAPGAPDELLTRLDLATRAGDPVAALSLERQAEPAQLVFAGDLPEPPGGPPASPAVATSHPVRDGARTTTYLVIASRLDRLAPALRPGEPVLPGATLGFAREGFTLEVRVVREGAPGGAWDARRLRDDAFSIATDPRNALPLAAP